MNFSQTVTSCLCQVGLQVIFSWHIILLNSSSGIKNIFDGNVHSGEQLSFLRNLTSCFTDQMDFPEFIDVIMNIMLPIVFWNMTISVVLVSWCSQWFITKDALAWWELMKHSVPNPLSYFSFQPVLHDWCNKGRGMCYPLCGMMHIKEPLLLIDKSSLCGGSGFPFSLSEWSLTMSDAT